MSVHPTFQPLLDSLKAAARPVPLVDDDEPVDTAVTITESTYLACPACDVMQDWALRVTLHYDPRQWEEILMLNRVCGACGHDLSPAERHRMEEQTAYIATKEGWWVDL